MLQGRVTKVQELLSAQQPVRGALRKYTLTGKPEQSAFLLPCLPQEQAQASWLGHEFDQVLLSGV